MALHEGVAFWYFTLAIGLLQYKLRTHGKGWHYTCSKTHLTMIHLCCPFPLKQNYNNALKKHIKAYVSCFCILNGNKAHTWPIMALKGTSQDQGKFFFFSYLLTNVLAVIPQGVPQVFIFMPYVVCDIICHRTISISIYQYLC